MDSRIVTIMKYHLLASICIASLVFVTSPANAQDREYSSGLNYTTLGTSQSKETASTKDDNGKAEQKPAKPKLFNTITPKHAEPTKEVAEEIIEETAEESSKTEESPAVTVWNKYKKLAAGTAADDKPKAEDTKTLTTSKPDKPTVDAPQAPTLKQGEVETRPAKNAFGSIIDEWQTSRDKQREMRSKTFAVPDKK